MTLASSVSDEEKSPSIEDQFRIYFFPIEAHAMNLSQNGYGIDTTYDTYDTCDAYDTITV